MWWRRWFLATTAGEFLGFAGPAVIGAYAFDLPMPAETAVLVGAGCLEGAVLGLAQGLVMHRAHPAISVARFGSAATAVGGGAAWLTAMAGVALIQSTVGDALRVAALGVWCGPAAHHRGRPVVAAAHRRPGGVAVDPGHGGGLDRRPARLHRGDHAAVAAGPAGGAHRGDRRARWARDGGDDGGRHRLGVRPAPRPGPRGQGGTAGPRGRGPSTLHRWVSGDDGGVMRTSRWFGWGLVALGTVVATTALLGPWALDVIHDRTSPTTLNQVVGGDAAAFLVVAPVTVPRGCPRAAPSSGRRPCWRWLRRAVRHVHLYAAHRRRGVSAASRATTSASSRCCWRVSCWPARSPSRCGGRPPRRRNSRRCRRRLGPGHGGRAGRGRGVPGDRAAPVVAGGCRARPSHCGRIESPARPRSGWSS